MRCCRRYPLRAERHGGQAGKLMTGSRARAYGWGTWPMEVTVTFWSVA